MQGEIKADPRVVGAGRTPLTQFFDGTVTPFNQQDKPLPDSSRVVQDEYLEWSVSRGPRRYTGDIYSVTFSAEGPEYWQLLASFQKGEFLKLTRDFNSGFTSQMSDSDFFLTDPMTKNKVYNPGNKWNLLSITGTIAHLIQAKNTLSAGIDIGAQARVIRKDDQGNVIEDKDDLINCSKYGNPGRNSDPTIGKAINDLACKGASLTVAEPAALYIRNFDTRNFQFHVFQWQRGDISTKHGLRIKFEVPKDRLDKHGKPLLVSNIYDTRTKWHIKYGAQFADYFIMGISAMGVKGKAANPEKCYQPSTKAAASVKPSCAEFDGFAHPGFAGAPGPSRA